MGVDPQGGILGAGEDKVPTLYPKSRTRSRLLPAGLQVLLRSEADEYIRCMKLVTNVDDVMTLDNELSVGGLVKSTIDENATGMIVQFLNEDKVVVLWSVPPKFIIGNVGEIW